MRNLPSISYSHETDPFRSRSFVITALGVADEPLVVHSFSVLRLSMPTRLMEQTIPLKLLHYSRMEIDGWTCC